jgi:dihydrofolate reductase
MRELRYSVAASLDGCIAGPNGEFDWIPMDPDIDFAAMYAGYSAIVMGRKSHDAAGGDAGAPGVTLPTYVCSRTQAEGTRKGVTYARDAVALVRRLKQEDGKPIWLWGGGELFRELADHVDGVDVAVIPILLGGGLPLLAPPAPRLPLTLRAHRLYPKTGIVVLEYDVSDVARRRRS